MTSKLQHLREARGWTRVKLSEEFGISTATIYKIESEKSQSSTNIGVAVALADALDCSVEDVINYDNLSWNVGRPPHTGTKIAPQPIRPHSDPVTCPDCFVQYQPVIGCESCGQPALSLT